MQSKSDAQLLRDYADHGAEAAFTEIVTRHTNLVYSAAIRQMDSPDIAADVTQSVFISLARGARTLSPRLAQDASLAGWLYRSARNIALNLRRNEFRQHLRERQVMEQLHPISEAAPDWERLRPVLDEAMSELSETDYDALVMRYFKSQDLRSIGCALGLTDDAAQKRVSRALDKLREHLSRRGISATAGALSIVLSANATQAAPTGLAAAISTAAIAGIAGGSAPTITLVKYMATIKMKSAVVSVDIAIGSARVLGIRLDPNFDRPYVSTSVTEFWRRWHMSLSFWLRDYLYMPLVIRIRRLGKTGIALALVFTFAVCGIWHGASWTFLLFGVAQGLAMTVEFLTKSWRTKRLKKLPRSLVSRLGNGYALGFFVLSQVLFRSSNLAQAGTIYSRLFPFRFAGGMSEAFGAWRYLLCLSCAAVAAWFVMDWFLRRASDRMTPWFVFVCGCWILFLGGLASGHFIYAAF